MITIYWAEDSTRTLPEGGDRVDLTVGLLELDILDTDTYDSEVTITAHAVESSAQVSDHVEQTRDRETFTVSVSGRQSSARLVEGARSGTVELPDGSEVNTIIVPEGTDRKGDVHEQLLALMKSATEIDVVGLQRDVEGWLIERVSAPRTKETSGILVCDVSIVELRRAEVEEVEAPSPRVERGRRRRDRGRARGRSTTGDASSSPGDRGQSVSVLQSAWNAISGSN